MRKTFEIYLTISSENPHIFVVIIKPSSSHSPRAIPLVSKPTLAVIQQNILLEGATRGVDGEKKNYFLLLLSNIKLFSSFLFFQFFFPDNIFSPSSSLIPPPSPETNIVCCLQRENRNYYRFQFSVSSCKHIEGERSENKSATKKNNNKIREE